MTKKRARAGQAGDHRPPPIDPTLPEKARVNARAAHLQQAVTGMTFPVAMDTRFGPVSFGSITVQTDVQGQDYAEIYLNGQNENDDPHFRVWNPPLLVPDPLGDIGIPNEDGTITTYREDPVMALAEALALRGGRMKAGGSV